MADGVSAALLVAGGAFFLAGSLGVVRFPDVYTRLHAVTKADNVGLGLVVLGLLVRTDDWGLRVKLVLVWLLVLVASATTSHLVARTALRKGVEPWRAP
jgi:multicomponent Na+:H+ antiporter subunit G